MSRTSKRQTPTTKPILSLDDPAQSDRFMAKAREIGADATPEIFEQAFRKVAFSQFSHPQPKRKRQRK
jgi:hypothetical protein